jgi:hypothetical protein
VIPFAAPALPLHSAGKYVAGAYIVFVVMLLVYLTIMAIRTSRTEREIAELRRELLARRGQRDDPEADREREAVSAR